MRAFLTLLRNGIHSDFTVEHEDTRYWFEINKDQSMHVDCTRVRPDTRLAILKDVNEGIKILEILREYIEKELIEEA